MAARIRKGDKVVVITGKDKGKRGIVLTVGENHVTVEGINLVKKHVKPNPMKGTTGGVEAKTMPLQISNVALVDANGKASRVGIKVEGDKKVRFLKTTGAVLTGDDLESVDVVADFGDRSE